MTSVIVGERREIDSVGPGTRQRRSSGVLRALQARECRSDAVTLVLFVLIGLGVLSSTRNSGSWFELPLLPALAVLAVTLAARAGGLRTSLALACVVTGSLALADQWAILPGGLNDLTVVSVGPLNARAFNAYGNLDYFSEDCGGRVSCLRVAHVETPRELSSWLVAPQQAALLLHQLASTHGRVPVVFFATQDPLFNTNTVALAAQRTYGQEWPIGVLGSRRWTDLSLQAQLESPEAGQPNLLIEGSRPSAPGARGFVPLPDDRRLPELLTADGFVPAGSIRLPDGRNMKIWWKDRGPAIPFSVPRH